MSVLKRMLALVLSLTVLPGYVLYEGLKYLIALAIMAVVAVIAIPVLTTIVLSSANFSILSNLLLTTFVATPLGIGLVSVLSIISAASTVTEILIDIVGNTWSGIKESLFADDGLEGFVRVFNAQSSYSSMTIDRARSFLNHGDGEHVPMTEMDFDGFQRIIGDLVDVVVERNTQQETADISEIQGAVAQTTAVLTPEELQVAVHLSADVSQSGLPLAQDIRNRVTQLNIRTERYNELTATLASVRDALGAQNRLRQDLTAQGLPEAEVQRRSLVPLEDLTDQLTNMPIEVPILFAKQYQQDGRWYTVPATSYVGDKNSLVTWMGTSPTHPLNRDLIRNPSLYEGMPTRYQWHELTSEHCSAQELDECAAEIRELSQQLQLDLQGLQQPATGLGGNPHTLFATHPAPAPSNGQALDSSLTLQRS